MILLKTVLTILGLEHDTSKNIPTPRRTPKTWTPPEKTGDELPRVGKTNKFTDEIETDDDKSLAFDVVDTNRRVQIDKEMTEYDHFIIDTWNKEKPKNRIDKSDYELVKATLKQVGMGKGVNNRLVEATGLSKRKVEAIMPRIKQAKKMKDEALPLPQRGV